MERSAKSEGTKKVEEIAKREEEGEVEPGVECRLTGERPAQKHFKQGWETKVSYCEPD